MFDFTQKTLFCFEYRLLKHKMTIRSENYGGHGPLGPRLAKPMLYTRTFYLLHTVDTR